MTTPQLDIDGPAAPPRRNGELAFSEPWESRAFGLAVALDAAGVIEWEAFRQQLIATIGAWEAAHAPDDESWSYWRCWQDALEQTARRPGRSSGRATSTCAPRSWRPGPRATTTTTEPITTTGTTTDLGKSLSVQATWEGQYRCRVEGDSFELIIDEPESAGGGGAGPPPTEVFLASLASCFTLAVHHVARKRDLTLPDLSVRAVGEYEGPKFATLRVEVTSSLAPEQLQPLLDRAAAVCYVSNTLRAVSEVEVVVTGPPA